MTLVGKNTCPTMDIEETRKEKNWLWDWIFNWSRISPIMLRNVEKKILSYLKTSYRGFYVDIGPAVSDADKIWTISMNTESPEIPLVLLHGLGAGVAMWVMNLDAFAKERPVYAMDVLGLGRSSRPKFSKDPVICEKQLVKSVEEWRREMNIPRMILLGHSFGGYIASSYSLSYPDRVRHLILADPWGIPEKPKESEKKIPLWARLLRYAITPLNPLWALRAAGPLGEYLVQKTRPDITRKYASFLGDDQLLLPQYIHQCNAQTPSGESAFHTMMESFGWAKYPMIHRMGDISPDIPITFIYGSRTWIDQTTGDKMKEQRKDSLVEVKTVPGAGHHLFADKPDIFNRFVNESCSLHKSPILTSQYIVREHVESHHEHVDVVENKESDMTEEAVSPIDPDHAKRKADEANQNTIMQSPTSPDAPRQ